MKISNEDFKILEDISSFKLREVWNYIDKFVFKNVYLPAADFFYKLLNSNISFNWKNPTPPPLTPFFKFGQMGNPINPA